MRNGKARRKIVRIKSMNRDCLGLLLGIPRYCLEDEL